MKSNLVDNVVPQEEKGRYTDLRVLRSAAGYYVGTMYVHPEGWEEPGSRDSDYFASKDEAEAYLTALDRLDEDFAKQFTRETP